MRRYFDILIPILVLIAALTLRMQDGFVVIEMRNRVFDAYQHLRPRPYLQQPVRILDIDDESLRRVGQWPWPRDILARVLDRLTASGVAAIAIDILQSEPDRTGPRSLLEQWKARPDAAALGTLLAKLPDPDAEYAAALARSPSVIVFSLSQMAGGQEPDCKVGFSSAGAEGDDARDYLLRTQGVTSALLEFEKSASGNGSVNAPADPDGIIRRVPLAVVYQDQICASLVAEALRVAEGAKSYIFKLAGANGEESWGARTGTTALRIGHEVVPVDSHGQMLLYDSGYQSDRFLPAWKTLEPVFDPTSVAGQVVFIGSTAEGLRDFKPTPLNPVSAGVEIHAQLLEQILGGQFLSRPDFADGAEIIFLLVFGLILIALLHRLGAFWSAVLTVATIAAAFALCWFAFANYGMLYDPVYPSLSAVAIYISGSLLGYLRTERERRHVRQTFSMYLAPAVVEELTRRQAPVKLGGELRNLTVMFSDIRDFTKIAEKLDPQALTHLINSILTPLTAAIQDRRGTIDKYIGDCIMAFWNAPLDDPDQTHHALQSALAMREALAKVNRQLAEEAQKAGKTPIAVGVGIGLNSGPCSVGNMGSVQRVAYSALGDTVNLASRLESLTRAYGVDIIVGEETAAGARDMALLEIDRVRVKGRAQPLTIYTLQSETRGPDFERLAATQDRFLAAYRAQDWTAASGELAACREMAPDLGLLYELFANRIADYLQEPPPPEWDGVFTAASKTG
jgi:adenylate cyclase